MKKPLQITIVQDRYNGAYVGGKWVAVPVDHACVDEYLGVDLWGDDVECMNFADRVTCGEVTAIFGIGETPNLAYEDLFVKFAVEK